MESPQVASSTDSQTLASQGPCASSGGYRLGTHHHTSVVEIAKKILWYPKEIANLSHLRMRSDPKVQKKSRSDPKVQKKSKSDPKVQKKITK